MRKFYFSIFSDFFASRSAPCKFLPKYFCKYKYENISKFKGFGNVSTLMLVGIDSIINEGVLESLWKPHKSKERNFLHRCYTQKKNLTFFKKHFGGWEKNFKKIFSSKFSKKNLKFSKSKKLKFRKFHDIFRFWEFHDFVDIFENFRKLPKIFRKKYFGPKKIIFVGVEIFFRWLVHELLGS